MQQHAAHSTQHRAAAQHAAACHTPHAARHTLRAAAPRSAWSSEGGGGGRDLGELAEDHVAEQPRLPRHVECCPLQCNHTRHALQPALSMLVLWNGSGCECACEQGTFMFCVGIMEVCIACASNARVRCMQSTHDAHRESVEVREVAGGENSARGGGEEERRV